MGIRSGNKVLLREAIQFYSKGLDAGATDASLISVLYANRAQVEIMLGAPPLAFHGHMCQAGCVALQLGITAGNWRKALTDSRDAVRVNPENIKVCVLKCCGGVKGRLEVLEGDKGAQSGTKGWPAGGGWMKCGPTGCRKHTLPGGWWVRGL
jgi:hypothetical protein